MYLYGMKRFIRLEIHQCSNLKILYKKKTSKINQYNGLLKNSTENKERCSTQTDGHTAFSLLTLKLIKLFLGPGGTYVAGFKFLRSFYQYLPPKLTDRLVPNK
ncbi:hypothetical protein J6590_020455 [Homalodisca vitripennis]|nr:hypothetical protein J6590_020455 [Homalodisca vitripennis]